MGEWTEGRPFRAGAGGIVISEHEIRATGLRGFVRVLFLLAILLCAGGHRALAQDAAGFFRANCYSCHTIGGGRVTGPDLKDVTSRQKRSWLLNFIQNPKEVIDGGDPYAQQLMKEARGVIMPRIPGLDAGMAEALLDLIETQGQMEESNFMGLQISDRPISEAEIAQGKSYFRGDVRLSQGGPACISCHSVSDTGELGGGQIGPNLTKVFERMGGRRALASWLMAPATPTMGAVFRDRALDPNEIAPISAFLEDAARYRSEIDPAAARSTFVFLGFVGGGVGLALLGQLWRRRLGWPS